jgi:hypothetical protein
MEKLYTIQLNERDLNQLILGLDIRAASMAKAAHDLRTKAIPQGEFCDGEQCRTPEEADNLKEHYRAIMRTIIRQR